MASAEATGACDAAELRRRFDAVEPYTVGLEEEALLVDAASGAPVPEAEAVVARAGGAPLCLELPACQVELVTEPAATAAEAGAQLRRARRALAAACPAGVVPIAAAVHPWAAEPMALSTGERAAGLHAAFGPVARHQLVSALQVHVAVGDAATTVAVHDALRSYLPELAALAAAAPFYGGADSGLASVRPLICGLLPRQGVPPALGCWEAHAAELDWGRRAGALPDPGRWWWELRPHVVHGTLELRVPDAQPSVAQAVAVASVVRALVVDLAERHRNGEPLRVHPSWRIAENRWAALRDGTAGEMADLDTGERRPTSARLHALVDRIERHAPGGLDPARALIAEPAAAELRAVGVERAIPWLAEAYAR